MVVDLAAGELDAVHERISGRFARAEPRARVREYVSGLVAGLERKNGWTLAERAGEAGPDGMQRLLRRADWDVDGVRDDVRDYVIEQLGDPGGVLIADETGFIKKGTPLSWGAAAVFGDRGADGELPGRYVPGLCLAPWARAD
jgi:SRSO17 transposase